MTGKKCDGPVKNVMVR